MKVNLLTDAPEHNLALMKLSAYHKAWGDEVELNHPLTWQADLSYGSWLFTYSRHYPCDFVGGPGVDPAIRLDVDDVKPDYELFPLDYSLGYTWSYCPHTCEFCVVPKQHNPKEHRSIWSFHDTRFQKICLLNNNTFSDPQWKETFEEIWDANLTVVDENGYDLRLLNDEKAEALAKTHFDGYIHFAWDRIKDESKIMRGLEIARFYSLRHKCLIYVLIGFDTTEEEDLYRCQKLHDMGFDPFIMVYNQRPVPRLHQFKRFINRTRYYRKYPTIKEAWDNYKPRRRR